MRAARPQERRAKENRTQGAMACRSASDRQDFSSLVERGDGFLPDGDCFDGNLKVFKLRVSPPTAAETTDPPEVGDEHATTSCRYWHKDQKEDILRLSNLPAKTRLDTVYLHSIS